MFSLNFSASARRVLSKIQGPNGYQQREKQAGSFRRPEPGEDAAMVGLKVDKDSVKM